MEMDKLLEWYMFNYQVTINNRFLLGWQTRWFVLENGILSYYKSQDEVNQGCKGSLKVQACQINGN